MDSSIPKFENPESLEQYLENLKLQLLTSEFAALGKISQDSGPHKEKNPSKIDGKLQARVENLEFFIRKQNGLNDDINPEFLLQSNFKLSEQEQNGQFQKKGESESEVTSTNSRDFVNSSTQTNYNSNTQPEKALGESHSGEIFSKELVPEASSFKTQACQTVSEQNSTNGFIKPKLIQPIYVVYPNQEVGYIEVDLTDENAMKNISELLQKRAE